MLKNIQSLRERSRGRRIRRKKNRVAGGKLHILLGIFLEPALKENTTVDNHLSHRQNPVQHRFAHLFVQSVPRLRLWMESGQLLVALGKKTFDGIHRVRNLSNVVLWVARVFNRYHSLKLKII